jgi:hypothetical protein
VSRVGISVAGEFGTIRRALQAVEALLEPIAMGEELSSDAGLGVLAIVSLAGARVELLRRAVVGAVDPAVLRTQHNEVIGARRPGDDPDVVLRVRKG